MKLNIEALEIVYHTHRGHFLDLGETLSPKELRKLQEAKPTYDFFSCGFQPFIENEDGTAEGLIKELQATSEKIGVPLSCITMTEDYYSIVWGVKLGFKDSRVVEKLCREDLKAHLNTPLPPKAYLFNRKRYATKEEAEKAKANLKITKEF